MALPKIVGGLLTDLAEEYGGRSARVPTRSFEMNEQAIVPDELQKPELVVGFQGLTNASDDPLEMMVEPKMLEANKMYRRGVTNEDIIAKTGFFFDGKGNIKKAIDDTDSELLQPWDDLEIGEDYTLGNILGHPSLYTYYPHFRDMKVEFYSGPRGEKGEFDLKNQIIKLNKNSDEFIDAGSDPTTAISTILHETQHAIQKLEKFTLGGDWKSFLKVPLDKATYEDKVKAFMKYLSIEGELEARGVEQQYIEGIARKYFNLKKPPRNFLQSLGQDDLSLKYNIDPRKPIDSRGNPLQTQDPFYQDPFERTV